MTSEQAIISMKKGTSLMSKCRYAVGGKVNELGEILLFCELTDSLENLTLGECIGNCESQELLEVEQ